MKNYKVFDAYKTNSVGVWFFAPKEGVYKEGKPCKGFGSVKYPEGSVYTGDIYYDGKNFNKIGYGQQDFSRSVIGYTDSRINEKKYKFVGSYDYRKTEWIYGNGVLYYTDESGKPSHFAKGFFSGLTRIGDYRGEFDYSLLLDGYSADMEFSYDENTEYIREVFEKAHRICDRLKCIDTLFVGDSYFGLSNETEFAGRFVFGKIFPDNFVNCGINGSRFCDWHKYLSQLTDLPQPEKIIVNLGFNDLHHGKSVKSAYSDYRKFLSQIRVIFPKSRLYLMQVVHAPEFPSFYESENEFNALTAKTAESLGVTVADWNDEITACAENCFHSDGIHPNEKGYGLFTEKIKRLLDG